MLSQKKTQKRKFQGGNFDEDMEVEPQSRYKGTILRLNENMRSIMRRTLISQHVLQMNVGPLLKLINTILTLYQPGVQVSTDPWEAAETSEQTTSPR